MYNYNEAKALFTRSKNPDKGYRLPGRLGSTRLVRTGNGFGIQLHGTVVVFINSDGTYVLNTGGYRTNTTKERINYYSPVRVFQQNHVWYVQRWHAGRYTNPVPYSDGIVVSKTGKVISEPNKVQNDKLAKILKNIDKYVNKYANALDKKQVPEPSNGDCWACLGIVPDNTSEHIISHMRENYLVPTLLVNAIRDKGYNPAYVNPWHGFRSDNKTFKRALKDYLKKMLYR